LFSLTRQSYIVLALLASLSILGNYWHLSLFFGVDFVFGSIALLIIIHLFGLKWGVIVALIASYPTIALWGHYYGLLVFTLEALFIGFTWYRYTHNLLLLESIFWFFLGLPLIGLIHLYVIQLDYIGTALILLKFLVNGIVNAALACLAVNHLPVGRWAQRPRLGYRPQLHQIVLNLIAAFVVLPALVIMTLDSWQMDSTVEQKIISDLNALSQEVSHDIHNRSQQHIQALEEIARLLAASPQPQSIDQNLEFIFNLFPEFLAVSVVDPQGQFLWRYPQKKLIHTVSDLPVQQFLTTSNVITAFNAIEHQKNHLPIIIYARAIQAQKRSIVLIYVDIGEILGQIRGLQPEIRQAKLTLTDHQGTVLTSTRSDLQPWHSYDAALKWHNELTYPRFPHQVSHTLLRWHNTIYVQHRSLSNTLPITLITEMPTHNYIEALVSLYIIQFIVISLVVLLSLMLAMFISRKLTQPLLTLSHITDNFPQRLEQNKKITWPKSQIREISALTQNFQVMAHSLHTRFEEIHSTNNLLEQRVQERTQQLWHERALLRNLIDSLPELIFYKNPDGTYLGCNKAFEKFAGCPEAQLIGKTERDIFSVEIAEFFRQQECKMLITGKVHSHEAWVSYPDGHQVLLDLIKTPFFGHQGEVLGLIGTSRDITARYQVEEKLRQSQAMLRLVIDNIPQNIFWKDHNGVYLGCNKNFAQRVGIDSSEAIIGKSDTEFRAQTYPGAAFFDTLNRCVNLNDGAPRYQLVESLISPQGIPLWFEINKIPLQNAQGELIGVLGSFEDITELKRVEEKLKQSIKVLENSAEAIMITDADTQILLVNKAFTEITGYSETEVLGKCPSLLKSGKHEQQFYQNMWHSIHTIGYWEGEIWNRRKQGELYPEWLHISVIKDEITDEITNFLAIFSDITSRKQTEQRLAYLAHYDDLTGLPNRALFYERVSRAIYHAQQHSGLVAVMFLDLDRFKYVNDTWGHVVGDLLLKEVAYRLTDCLHKTNTVARLGGDDFAIVLEKVKNTKQISDIAQRLLDAMLSPFYLEGHETFVTVSIGVSVYPNDGEDVDTLLKNADAAMYRAKERGRNNYQFFIAQMNIHVHQRLLLETKLRHALERNELVLYYQPQMHLGSGLIVGAEVLLRWQHPEMGLVLPYHFIPLAEETGLIVPIGEWVLEHTCLQHQQWRQQGQPILRMSVNLSACQFRQENLTESIIHIVESNNIDPTLLELELTESILMQDVDMANQTLHQLKDRGIQLAIDDFGTGYSSLNYLKRFPIDKLKIDQSFVRDIPQNKDDMSITRAIIALGRSLNLNVIAEGVETLSQQAFLKSLKCDEVQGYLIGPPLPAADFIDLCQKNIYFINNQVTQSHH